MLILNVIRHADAVQNSISGKDFERQLSSFGIQQAQQLGKFIAENKFNLGTVYCSSAHRTKHTFELISNEQKIPIPCTFIESIYEVSLNELIEFLSKIKETTSEVTIIGHNSGVSNLVSHLCGEYIFLNPANFVRIELSITSWDMLIPGIGKCKFHFEP